MLNSYRDNSFIMSVVSFIIFSLPAWAADLPLNPAVTNDTINQTICVHGWTSTIRPPVTMTAPIKHRLMSEYGIPPEGEANIKLDHRIPLALGGNPSNPMNLILQLDDEAHDKDRVEVCLSRSVCAHRITLRQAQLAIWNNWRTAAALCSGYKIID